MSPLAKRQIGQWQPALERCEQRREQVAAPPAGGVDDCFPHSQLAGATPRRVNWLAAMNLPFGPRVGGQMGALNGPAHLHCGARPPSSGGQPLNSPQFSRRGHFHYWPNTPKLTLTGRKFSLWGPTCPNDWLVLILISIQSARLSPQIAACGPPQLRHQTIRVPPIQNGLVFPTNSLFYNRGSRGFLSFCQCEKSH